MTFNCKSATGYLVLTLKQIKNKLNHFIEVTKHLYKALTLFQSLLTCEALKQGSKGQDSQQPKYSDIFIEDMRKLTAITKVLHKNLKISHSM